MSGTSPKRRLRKLDGKIPYSLLPGNHDQAQWRLGRRSHLGHLDQRFSPVKQKQSKLPAFGGVYDQEPNARNNYYTFTGTGRHEMAVLSIEFGPRDDVIRWAGDIIEKNLDYRVMLVPHSLTAMPAAHDRSAWRSTTKAPATIYGIGNGPRRQ